MSNATEREIPPCRPGVQPADIPHRYEHRLSMQKGDHGYNVAAFTACLAFYVDGQRIDGVHTADPVEGVIYGYDMGLWHHGKAAAEVEYRGVVEILVLDDESWRRLNEWRGLPAEPEGKVQ